MAHHAAHAVDRYDGYGAYRGPVEVRRSSRRSRTVSARREGDRIVVLVPARLSPDQEREWVGKMVARLSSPAATRRREARSDDELVARAAQLSTRYLDGRARPTSVRWVGELRTRWASCTPADGTIRLSARLRDMPGWVIDYVIVHELAHLLVAGHNAQFWSLVGRYPRTERARGYLAGVSAAANLEIDQGDSEDEDGP